MLPWMVVGTGAGGSSFEGQAVAHAPRARLSTTESGREAAPRSRAEPLYSLATNGYTIPAAAAPRIGATQNNQSCSRAQPPTKRAGPVLRAGLTEVLVTGIEIRWIKVRPSPIAIGANPAGARRSVAPRMTIKKKNVITTSHTNPA